MENRLAVIDTGGGMRGAYAAGILDFCLDHDIHCDLCIGISAGATNLISYLSRQRGRNYLFYTEYLTKPEHMSLKNLRHLHAYSDFDYMVSISAPDGINPLDTDTLSSTDQELVVVATDSSTGSPVYFGQDKLDMETMSILRASYSIPMISASGDDRNITYFDGTISDPLPIDLARRKGADKTIVIVNKNCDKPRSESEDRLLRYLFRHYPAVVEKLKDRNKRYNDQLKRVRKMEKDGSVLLLYPDDMEGVRTLSRNPEDLKKLYEKGYRDGRKILTFLEKPVGSDRKYLSVPATEEA